MTEPFYGVPRGRKRDAFDHWVRVQEQTALYSLAESHYVHPAGKEIHDGGDVAVAALTDKVCAPLYAVGVYILNH